MNPCPASIKRQIEREGPRHGLFWKEIRGKVYAAERVPVTQNHYGIRSVATSLQAIRLIEKPGDWLELFRLKLGRHERSLRDRLAAREAALAKEEADLFEPVDREIKAMALKWAKEPVTVHMR